MRALTVRQPWAEAIADGAKTIENRSAGFPKAYRGPLLIHAGAAWSERGQRDPRIRHFYGCDLGQDPPWLDRHRGTRFSLGAAIALADVVDIHPAAGCCTPWGEETYPPANPEGRPPGRVTHLVLEHALRLPRAIPAKGALGLWRPDPDLELEVAHGLAELCTWDRAAAESLAERGAVDLLWAAVRHAA